jgi:hypothetical protein
VKNTTSQSPEKRTSESDPRSGGWWTSVSNHLPHHLGSNFSVPVLVLAVKWCVCMWLHVCFVSDCVGVVESRWLCLYRLWLCSGMLDSVEACLLRIFWVYSIGLWRQFLFSQCQMLSPHILPFCPYPALLTARNSYESLKIQHIYKRKPFWCVTISTSGRKMINTRCYV